MKGCDHLAGALEDSRRIFIVMLHFYGTCEDTKIWAKIISALAGVGQKGYFVQTSRGMNT